MTLRETLIRDVALAPVPQSVRAAHRFTVSELVSNAVQHGGPR
jgi:anti-sigma regulatory factor (Ser/Thr protein kinase)